MFQTTTAIKKLHALTKRGPLAAGQFLESGFYRAREVWAAGRFEAQFDGGRHFIDVLSSRSLRTGETFGQLPIVNHYFIIDLQHGATMPQRKRAAQRGRPFESCAEGGSFRTVCPSLALKLQGLPQKFASKPVTTPFSNTFLDTGSPPFSCYIYPQLARERHKVNGFLLYVPQDIAPRIGMAPKR